MIPKFKIFDKKKKRFLDNFTMEIDRYGIHVLDEFNYVVDEDDRVLMQSTGLHDKNGKEIFEGDIVRAEHDNFSMDEVPPEYKPYVGFIKYVKTGYSIITKDTYHPCLSNIRITNIEVLGNIHEHSHLLDDGGEQ